MALSADILSPSCCKTGIVSVPWTGSRSGSGIKDFRAAENLTLNLEEKDACLTAVKGCDRVYNLAADMGGMGFIELNKGLCMLTVLINTHMLMAARACGATRFFYSSSACVYAGFKQQRSDIPGLKEDGRLSCRSRGRLWLGKAL